MGGDATFSTRKDEKKKKQYQQWTSDVFKREKQKGGVDK